MIRSSHLALALALALAPLCSGCASETAAAQPAPKKASTEPTDVCAQTFTRARECTSDYIPALVDTRAKHDVPAGIAEAVKKDRDAVIKEALEEWKTDSQDANIAATCDHMSAQMGSDQEMTDTAKGCLAKADCVAFTTCVMPLFEKHIRK